jgi:hypothetical protein
MTHDEDDTQVQADTLLIVYQRGFADGKRSTQRKPLTIREIGAVCGTFADETILIVRQTERAHNIKEQP